MSETRQRVSQFTGEREITQHDLDEFALISGDDNPIHVDAEYAATTSFMKPVAHGMFLFSLVRAQLRKRWPTARLIEQQLQFLAPTPVGSRVTVRVELRESVSNTLRVSTEVTGHDGSVGLTGVCLLEVQEGSPA